MRAAEKGLLMLTCALGQAVAPLSLAEYQSLARRITPEASVGDEDVTEEFLCSLGYSLAQAKRIVGLLEREEALSQYLSRSDIEVTTRISDTFPQRLRCLGDKCPPVLFCKGDLSLLQTPCVALVGSRSLPERNRRFAQRIGTMAAREGFTLVSGGAVGADSAAQEACLAAGGRVICFIPDALYRYHQRENVLYCSADGWEFAFSSARALRRNHFIHALSEKSFVACCPNTRGGTWSGTTYNLRCQLSPVYILDDKTEGVAALRSMGAVAVGDDLASIAQLQPSQLSIFD